MPPLERITAQAERISLLCDLLEAIADSLPSPEAGACEEAAQICRAEVHRHYEDVNTVLIPALRSRVRDNPDRARLLARIEEDLHEDATRLAELIDILGIYGAGRESPLNAEAFGYALRGFFETIRRQLSWEAEVLVPMADQVLEDGDLDIMAQRLASRDSCGPCPNAGKCGCRVTFLN